MSMINKKTLADFKRDAKNGGMVLTMTERYGKEPIDRLKGPRPVIKTNSVAVTLRNANGESSELRFDNAALFEYTGETLVVYAPKKRDLTEDERKVLDGINEIYRKTENSYANPYWNIKDYVTKSNCPWMYGSKIKGKYFLQGENKVLDHSIRGEAILKYTISFEKNNNENNEGE